jgi:lysophospholipase L1-like esterase
MLFLGDSLTERWDPALWHDHMAARGILNVGVSGDRTEHLLWRLDHGNLAGPAPQAVILLIGTNDIGHGRSPDVAAEGVRAVLVKLRERLPNTRILLLGLLPREEAPNAWLRQQVNAVNRLIETCGDNQMIFFADIGGPLLDAQGLLSRAVAPDQLHFSAAGYARLAPTFDRLIDVLPPTR